MDINKLIGIPFRIGRETLEGCDCVGIAWLYHKYMHGKDYPHRDNKRMWLRDPKEDIKRITKVIETWAFPVPFDALDEGDIIIIKTNHMEGSLGVCIDRYGVLHMDLKYGSMVSKLSYFKNFFLRGYRPNDKVF